MRRMTASDVAYLDAERPTTPPVMAAVIVLDPSTAPGSFVRHRDVLAYVEERLHLAPNLRKRILPNPLKLDEPRLVDDANFDLEFHVRHLALPRPRDRRQFNILAARLISRPMDLSRPLWELYIIEGLESFDDYPEDTFAVLIKLHHAAFDGAAGLAAIFAMMQTSPKARPDPAPTAWLPQREPGVADWAVSSLVEGASQLAANMQSFPALLKGVYEGVRAAELDVLSTAPTTRFQGPISTHRVLDWVNLPMSDVQAVRTALGKPKMNDLVLCMIGGALRRYLQSKGELSENSMIAICPINVRGSGDPKAGGNQLSVMRVRLGTDIADPRQRLEHIQASSKAGKDQAEKFGASFMGDLMALYPYPIRSALMKGAVALAASGSSPLQAANIVVSNIPPPRGDAYFAGSKFLEFTGFGPLTPGMGLFHTVSGMEAVMSLAVNSCREMMPDIAFYTDCVRESFEEIRSVADA